MYPFLLKTYQRFLHFLRKPDDRSFARVGFSFKVRTIAGLFLLNVFLAGLWILAIYLLGVKDLENVNSKMMDMSYGMLVLSGVILVPFIEEMMFRFPLKYSRNYVLQLLIAIVALFAPEESKAAIYADVRTFWKRFFWIFFYVMTSTFAFIHIFNYTDAKQLLLWSPLLTMSQFITGLILGYIRVRFGLLWSWAYHGFFNLLFFSLAFLPGEQTKKMDFETFMEKHTFKTDTLTIGNPNLTSIQYYCDEYTLKIRKATDSNSVFTGYYGVTPDSIYFEQCSLEKIMRILTKDSITLLDSNHNRYYMKFNRLHTKMKRTSKDILLEKIAEAFSLK